MFPSSSGIPISAAVTGGMLLAFIRLRKSHAPIRTRKSGIPIPSPTPRPTFDPLLNPPTLLLVLSPEPEFPLVFEFNPDSEVFGDDPEVFELSELVKSIAFQAILILYPFAAPDVNVIIWLDVPPPACQSTVPVPGEPEENEVQQSNPYEFIE